MPLPRRVEEPFGSTTFSLLLVGNLIGRWEDEETFRIWERERGGCKGGNKQVLRKIAYWDNDRYLQRLRRATPCFPLRRGGALLLVFLQGWDCGVCGLVPVSLHHRAHNHRGEALCRHVRRAYGASPGLSGMIFVYCIADVSGNWHSYLINRFWRLQPAARFEYANLFQVGA